MEADALGEVLIVTEVVAAAVQVPIVTSTLYVPDILGLDAAINGF